MASIAKKEFRMPDWPTGMRHLAVGHTKHQLAIEVHGRLVSRDSCSYHHRSVVMSQKRDW